MVFVLIALNLLLTFQKSNAIAPEAVLVNQQFLTPEINYSTSESPPSDFYLTNNLIRKTGSPFFAKGEPLIITGKVLDINNAPVDGANIYLWHANSSGYFNYQLNDENANYDQHFAGSAVTKTDNTGLFSFQTVFPAKYDKRVPHLHLMVEFAGQVYLTTQIFFEEYPLNTSDPIYKRLLPNERDLVTAEMFFIDSKKPELGKHATITITINLNQTYKKI